MDGAPSALLSLMPTPDLSCSPASATVASLPSPSGTTCEPSTASRGGDTSMSSVLDFRANRSATLPSERSDQGSSKTMTATSGPIRGESLAKYDRVSCSWRTYQTSLPLDTGELSSVTWQNSGTMCDGILYRPARLVRHIHASGCGRWPTMAASRWKAINWKRVETGHRVRDTLENAVASEEYHAGRMKRGNGGQLSPNWVEWLMGFPLGWTAVLPSATAKFRQWCALHGAP